MQKLGRLKLLLFGCACLAFLMFHGVTFINFFPGGLPFRATRGMVKILPEKSRKNGPPEHQKSARIPMFLNVADMDPYQPHSERAKAPLFFSQLTKFGTSKKTQKTLKKYSKNEQKPTKFMVDFQRLASCVKKNDARRCVCTAKIKTKTGPGAFLCTFWRNVFEWGKKNRIPKIYGKCLM